MKKTIAIVLALVLLLATFTACAAKARQPEKQSIVVANTGIPFSNPDTHFDSQDDGRTMSVSYPPSYTVNTPEDAWTCIEEFRLEDCDVEREFPLYIQYHGVELVAETIPKWLSLDDTYPEEDHFTPWANLLRQTALYAHINPSAPSFAIETTDGTKFLSYDATTKSVRLSFPPDVLNYFGPFNYQIGQSLLPDCKEILNGEKLNWDWVEQVLKSFSVKDSAWIKMDDTTWSAWTHGLNHRLTVVQRDDNSFPTLSLDGVNLAYVAEERDDVSPDVLYKEYRNGQWDGQIVRCGREYSALYNGQIVTLSRELAYFESSDGGSYHVDKLHNALYGNIEHDGSDLWQTSGYWVIADGTEGHYVPHGHAVAMTRGEVADDKGAIIVTLSKTSRRLTVYDHGWEMERIELPDFEYGRLYTGGCGCVLAVTNCGTWRIFPGADRHDTNKKFDAQNILRDRDVSSTSSDDIVSFVVDDTQVNYDRITIIKEPDIRLIAMTENGDTAIISVNGKEHYVTSPWSWQYDYPSVNFPEENEIRAVNSFRPAPVSTIRHPAS